MKTRRSMKMMNNKGMAIIMVTSAVAILSLILVEFTFETKLNKIKSENQVDRIQAKLNAESGLNLALSKLKIYRKAWNLLEDNESMKKTVPPSMAEKVVTTPFIYPIVLDKRANIIQKSAVEDFEKNNLLKGELSVSISPLTGFLNPNTLKIIKDNSKTNTNTQSDNDSDKNDDNDGEGNQSSEALKPYAFMEKTFIETLDKIVKEKIENDEDFALKYSNLNIELLVKEVKYYINNPKDYDDAEKAEIEKNYELAGIQAKHAPMDSIDEMYMLQGWDDDIVNLLIDKMSVHQVSVININEITKNQLKVLFPTITEFQLETFFKRRNGDIEQGQAAEEFKDQEEFKKYITDELGVTDATNYDKRITEFKNAGITLGVAAKLFKVISKGTFNRANVTIEAYIDLPVKPDPPSKKDDKNKKTTTAKDDTSTQSDDEDEETTTDSTQDDDSDKSKSNKKTYLLAPRVVEIRTY